MSNSTMRHLAAAGYEILFLKLDIRKTLLLKYKIIANIRAIMAGTQVSTRQQSVYIKN